MDLDGFSKLASPPRLGSCNAPTCDCCSRALPIFPPSLQYACNRNPACIETTPPHHFQRRPQPPPSPFQELDRNPHPSQQAGCGGWEQGRPPLEGARLGKGSWTGAGPSPPLRPPRAWWLAGRRTASGSAAHARKSQVTPSPSERSRTQTGISKRGGISRATAHAQRGPANSLYRDGACVTRGNAFPAQSASPFPSAFPPCVHRRPAFPAALQALTGVVSPLPPGAKSRWRRQSKGGRPLSLYFLSPAVPGAQSDGVTRSSSPHPVPLGRHGGVASRHGNRKSARAGSAGQARHEMEPPGLRAVYLRPWKPTLTRLVV